MADWLDGYFENKPIIGATSYNNNTIFGPDGNFILNRVVSAVRVALVEPSGTFISVTPSSAAAGADTLLTSAGVHGLTSAVSVGAAIYISAGTGWTVGFHTITAIAVDATGTTIQIDTPFDVGFGTPTIALASTEVTVATIAIPPLFENSYIDIDYSYSWTNSGNTKTYRIKYGGTTFSILSVSASLTGRSSTLISNRGATNSQLGGLSSGAVAAGYGTAGIATTTGSINSSITQNLVITLQPNIANESIAIDRYIINIWR